MKQSKNKESKSEKKRILAFYENLLNELWKTFSPVLGDNAMAAIINRAQKISSIEYKILNKLSQNKERISLKEIEQRLDKIDTNTLKNSLTKFSKEFMNILKVLTEDIILKMAKNLYKKTGIKNLCYAGGVALNSKANYRLLKETEFENVFIQPAATDAGGALGAALWVWHQLFDKKEKQVLEHAYLGKGFSYDEIKNSLQIHCLLYTSPSPRD